MHYLSMDLRNLFLFPGVIFHELAHYLACVILGVRVHRAKLGLKEASIMHESRDWKNIPIALSPFLLGSIASLLFLFIGHLGIKNLLGQNIKDYLVILFFYYLALSIAYHSFPSKIDNRNALNSLLSFYKRKLLLRDGIIEGLAWFITIPFIFFPLLLIIFIMLLFSSIENLGFLWFILLFLGSAIYIGI